MMMFISKEHKFVGLVKDLMIWKINAWNVVVMFQQKQELSLILVH
jgi:hypothetical protein